MAEGLFRKMTEHLPGIVVGSAGVHAADGQKPSEPAVAAMREMGIDISSQRSRFLTPKIARAADAILVMTQSHLMAVIREHPEVSDKVFLVREFVPGIESYEIDVPDPIGMGLQTYRLTRDAISEGITSFIRQFMNPSTSTEKSENQSDATPGLPSVAIAADHGGVALKNALVQKLKASGRVHRDFGTNSQESVDYPDFAGAVCAAVTSGEFDFGVLICTTGIGMSIAANRHPAIRAALVHDAKTAAITRAHNNANVLCLAGATTAPETAASILDTFLSTDFEGGRHARRVGKIGSGSIAGSLASADPEIAALVASEVGRQSSNIELIASENFTSAAVMEAQGSVLTNKYAEGYPGKRWYGGCEFVDGVEQLAIDRAKQLFGAEHANVQPHSGSQANMAVYFSMLETGDKILTMDLSHGGHLTHGNKANFSGKFFEVTHYGVSEQDERIDYDKLEATAVELRPKMITAGASAYPRVIDFERLRAIADKAGALLFVDMAHIAGLVAAGVHPSPIPHAHFVTTTTHKSLRGPRGGLILCGAEYAKKIDAQVFPGVQGGPLMHVIAAKAVCFHQALQPGFVDYQRQVVSNAKAMAARLAHNGFRIVSGGTDNHLMLVDLRPKEITGVDAQTWLDEAGITINKNSIPFDTLSVFKSGGIRIGSPAATTRGLKEEEMMEVADFISEVLDARGDKSVAHNVRKQVQALMAKFPLPGAAAVPACGV